MTTTAKAKTKGPRLVRWLKLGGGTALVLVGAVGFLHTKAGRPILAALGVGCPAMRVTPAQVETVRQRALTALRGNAPAASRPAFGLALDVTTEADAKAWAAARGLDCVSAQRPTRHLTCNNVPAKRLTGARDGQLDELNLTFFPDGRLLGVETLRRHLDGDEAARLFTAITTALDAHVGTATERAGTPTAEYLDGGAMHTAFARYRYSDYLATVTAMNLSGRVALREQYQSARAPS
jgi:hypothetical protein